jgi:hypothetical protein
MIIMGNYYRLIIKDSLLIDCLSLAGFMIWV